MVQDSGLSGEHALYEKYMAEVFTELYKLVKPGGKLICIAGDVRRRSTKSGGEDSCFETGTVLADLCQLGGKGFVVEEYSEQIVPSKTRYLHALNKTNGHRSCSLTERVFVASKPITPEGCHE